MSRDSIDYVLGADAGIADLLTDQEVLPFLEEAMAAGLQGVRVSDRRCGTLWEAGLPNGDESHVSRLFLEGEPVGSIHCVGRSGTTRIAGEIMAGAFNLLLFGSLKRKLTTEVHTHAINQSYDELVESEQHYRELATSLEVRVEKRTSELRQAYNRMLQQEKLVSVGQLAAGVAHEINNPMSFILSNFTALEKYVGRFRDTLLFCRDQLAAGSPSGFQEEFEQRWTRLKLASQLDDAIELIHQSRDGGERVKKIVSDLKGFSHIDHSTSELVDLNEELDRTLNVMTHQIPAEAQIIRDFEPLPKIPANPALLCQAFFNLIQNALQCRSQGLILTLSTSCREKMVQVAFEDNGPGIPDSLQSRIFEPFFTMRDVGGGVGLGLALVYDIVRGLGGTIMVNSRCGEGSCFTIELPYGSAPHAEQVRA